MSEKKKSLSQSAATIIAAVIAFWGIVVAGYFSIRVAETPIELVISPSQTAEVNLPIFPTIMSKPTQIYSPNIITEFISVNILRPSQSETHPLFSGEYEFTTYSAKPIILEFVVINTTKKSVDIQQVFTDPKKGFDVILYSPDYSYKYFLVSPVNIDSSLNNRYYIEINIPPSEGRFLEGEYTLEIKPNLRFINSPYQFDNVSYLVNINIKNTLDTGRFFSEMLVVFVIFIIAVAALINVFIYRYSPKALEKNS